MKPLVLNPDRLFPADEKMRDIARALYAPIAGLPIISPHGHTDPSWFALDEPFGNATELLLVPDHYVLRMLYSQGFPLEKLGVASKDGGEVADPRERGMAFFLFGALQQFYFDGNKRTSRFMMNGILMSHGFDAISVPAKRAQEFNENMVRFYLGKDATEMMRFLIDCQPKNAPTPKPAPSSGPSM